MYKLQSKNYKQKLKRVNLKKHEYKFNLSMFMKKKVYYLMWLIYKS